MLLTLSTSSMGVLEFDASSKMGVGEAEEFALKNRGLEEEYDETLYEEGKWYVGMNECT